MAKTTFHCFDAHTCGNPVRLVVSGGPLLKSESIAEKRLEFLESFDWIRQGLMFEPRGHDMMSGGIFYPASDPDNDIALLFMETSGCLPMCGHGTIGAITIGIEKNLIRPRKQGVVRLETPAGLVTVRYKLQSGKVVWVEFTNVPSFLVASDLIVENPLMGKLTFDVAYGGNFYAIIDRQENYRGLESMSAADLIERSREIREKINEEHPGRFVHPVDSSIAGLSHVMWTGDPVDPRNTSRNAVFYGDKAIDRSPCGTGTSARMAQWHTKGKLGIDRPFLHESIIGSVFEGRILNIAKVGVLPGIIPSIRGWARIFGENRITIDDEDPFAKGFQVI